jgi:SAM-dependent methyltransferase
MFTIPNEDVFKDPNTLKFGWFTNEELEMNIKHLDEFLQGTGFDMGCGACPLPKPNCMHIDYSHQPEAIEKVGVNRFLQADASKINKSVLLVDYVFSSHMVEDLPSKDAMVECLMNWKQLLKKGGHLVILVPDMEGGRYPKVEEGGNPAHRINVGKDFFLSIVPELEGLELVQLNTIDYGCSMDVVLKRI